MLHILLIDDEPQDRILVRRKLEREFSALQITEIAKAEELSQALETLDFDIAITDYQLRWSDGLAVLRSLKAQAPDRPVIMFTNSGSEEIAVEAMKSGLEDYVLKSATNFTRLVTAVRLALQRTEERRQLSRLEVRLQSLLNRLDVGVFRSTLDGQLLEANAAFLQLLAVNTLAEAQSLNLQALLTQPQVEQLSRDEQLLPREIELCQTNGTKIWVSCSQTLSSNDGEVFIDGLVEDISDAHWEATLRKQAELALQQANEALEIRVAERTAELERANEQLRAEIAERQKAEAAALEALETERELSELKSRIITTISHEYRTPLTAILSSAELLEHYSYKWTEERKLSHLHRIQSSVKHLTNLVNDVLFLSKAEAERVEFNPMPLDVEQFCRELVEQMHSNASSQTTITLNSRGNCTNAYLDEKLLRQILTNLLSNAIKYSPDVSTVLLDLECVNGVVRFRIQDSGIGIPEADLANLFESFHRASNVGTVAGTGLGLAIVKKCVDLHEGEITVDSVVNVGTTFTVTLPLSRE